MSYISRYITFITQPKSVKVAFKQLQSHHTNTSHILYLTHVEIERIEGFYWPSTTIISIVSPGDYTYINQVNPDLYVYLWPM